jgi:hypothetical protein
MSPYQVLSGSIPRTELTGKVDWTTPNFGEEVFGIKDWSYDDYADIVARHHEHINAVQARAQLASSVAQMLTKRKFDAYRSAGDFKVGEDVLVLRPAPNRMLPNFVGPYCITWVSEDGNFVRGKHCLDEEGETGRIHVSRLLHFDASRKDDRDVGDFYTRQGEYIVEKVLEHRETAAGTLEFHIKWFGYEDTTWEDVHGWKVTEVIKYCEDKGLPPPSGPKKGAREERALKRAAKAVDKK